MSKTKKQVLQDPLLRKCHEHKPKVSEPEVCPYCEGRGKLDNHDDCYNCQGTGEVW